MQLVTPVLIFKVIKLIELVMVIKFIEVWLIKQEACHLNQVSQLVVIKFEKELMLKANIMMKSNNLMH